MLQKTATKKVIRTPRPYLSWSQLNLIERNPIEYATTYIYGEGRTNPRMELGKVVGEMIRKGEEQSDPNIEFYRTFLPVYPHTEFEVPRLKGGEGTCQCKKCIARGIEEPLMLGDISLYGKLDGWCEKKVEVGEDKTGSKWTQKMADESGQLDYYSLLLYLKYKISPEDLKIKLNWMPTVIDPIDGVKLTGDLKIFETRRDMADLVEMMGRIRRGWKNIIELCQGEYAALGL